MKRSSRENKGFTLIELVIVVAVLAILVGLLAPSYTKYVKKSKVTKCEAQRDEIERVYQIACIEDASLSNKEFDGDTIIDQLAKLGYFDKQEAKCPVYNEPYKVYADSRKGTIEVECPCVNSLLNYLKVATDIYTNNNPYRDRKLLIEDFYNKLGRLPEVSQSMKKNTKYENLDKPLYWRPYNVNENTMIMFASDAPSGYNGWKAGLLYINGKIYEASGSATDNKGNLEFKVNIADIYHIGEANYPQYPTLDDWLKVKGFELIS